MNKDPPDQFKLLMEEARVLHARIEHIDRSMQISRGIYGHPATRALEKARTKIEEATYWLGKAIERIAKPPV